MNYTIPRPTFRCLSKTVVKRQTYNRVAKDHFSLPSCPYSPLQGRWASYASSSHRGSKRTHEPRTTQILRSESSNLYFATGGGVFALIFALIDASLTEAKTSEPTEAVGANTGTKSLLYVEEYRHASQYRLSEIEKHGSTSDRPWIIYQDKVYDITDWVSAHPGGEVILQAAGGHIEPYWDIFTIHKSQHVHDILEQYAIGMVHPEDLKNDKTDQIDDPFVSDPHRDARLLQLTQKPYNAETPGAELANSFLTPNETFYVRNHMWVPMVDNPEDYAITVELPSGNVRTYTVRELKSRFKQHAVTAVMQCSGNRRKNMSDGARKTNGLQWTVGAISCAKWEGVRLRDILTDAGLSLEPDEEARHVQFSGAEAYGASIPISSALDVRGDVLLAMRMNDEPLPRDHGYPIRVVVPGHVAARCVKWLKKIVVSNEESNTTWQRRDYKCFGPNETRQDWEKYKSIQKMPITSAVTRTRLKDSMSSEHQVLQVEGYAYSGGGHEIQRVDISLDGGKTWDQASLVQSDKGLEHGSQSWCWKRWTYEAHVPSLMPGQDENGGTSPGESKLPLVVKATDCAYNTQPESFDSIYNLRGNLATAWHRVEFDCGNERRVQH